MILRCLPLVFSPILVRNFAHWNMQWLEQQAEKLDERDERQRFGKIKVSMLDILITELSKFAMREDAVKNCS